MILNIYIKIKWLVGYCLQSSLKIFGYKFLYHIIFKKQMLNKKFFEKLVKRKVTINYNTLIHIII